METVAMTTAKKTTKINRGTLLRAARKGHLWIRCDMRLTDDYAGDAADGFGKETEFTLVVLDEERLQWDQRPDDGCAHLSPSDFAYSTGYVGQPDANGDIHWTMLCNHYYTVRISDN